MLTLHPAFPDEGTATLAKVRAGDFKPVAERNPRRPVPEFLADLCARGMATDPAERPESAEAFEEELRAWLDGRSEAERRHREAESLAEQGQAAAKRFWAMTEELLAAEDEVEKVAAQFKSWQPVREKGPLLDAQQRVTTLTTDLALAFAETVKLTLRSEPVGADVLLYRLVEREGILVPEEERRLGATPVGPVDLPMGSYLAILKSPGHRDVRYPVHTARNRDWSGTVTMRTEEEIGQDFVFVPGGPFVYGEGKETREIGLPDFAIARYPVTFAEYGAFLDALPEEEAAEHLPRTQTEGPLMEKGEDGRCSLRVLRGGSWNVEVTYLRCAFRFRNDPRSRNAALGFRCARGLL